MARWICWMVCSDVSMSCNLFHLAKVRKESEICKRLRLFLKKTFNFQLSTLNFFVPLYRTMSDIVTHSGIIERIDGSTLKVRIVQTSACAACKVAGHCHAAEAKEKIVDVVTPDASRWQVGERVTVAASRQMATQALLLAFGLPLVIMLAVLLAVLLLTGREGLAALCGLGALLPYYAVLWLTRKNLQRRLAFWIKE